MGESACLHLFDVGQSDGAAFGVVLKDGPDFSEKSATLRASVGVPGLSRLENIGLQIVWNRPAVFSLFLRGMLSILFAHNSPNSTEPPQC